MSDNQFTFSEVLKTIRRIIRAIDIHSKELGRTAGVTGPQLIALKEIEFCNRITTTKLAENINLSQSTVTIIVDKLVEKEMVNRVRDDSDKRQWYLELSASGARLSENQSFVLPKQFMTSFSDLPLWRQTQILATLQHVAEMMTE